MVCSDIYYIINSYRYVCFVYCIVTEKPHQGSTNKVLYCIVLLLSQYEKLMGTGMKIGGGGGG